MDFGLEVIGDSKAVTISSYNKVLVFSERGSFSVQSRFSDATGTGVVSFTKPVRTEEAPQLFVRIVTPNGPVLTIYTTILGGPGNWTGFRITSAASGFIQGHTLEYVCCKYSDNVSSDTYGLQIWDKDGGPIYASSDRVVRYGKFTKSWTYSAGGTVPNSHDTWNSNISIEIDDFISVSSIDRGTVWFTGHYQYTGLQLLVGYVRLLKIDCQRSYLGNGLFSTSSFFSMPICKFPIAKYYNS